MSSTYLVHRALYALATHMRTRTCTSTPGRWRAHPARSGARRLFEQLGFEGGDVFVEEAVVAAGCGQFVFELAAGGTELAGSVACVLARRTVTGKPPARLARQRTRVGERRRGGLPARADGRLLRRAVHRESV